MVWLICGMLAVAAIGFTLWVREKDIPPAPVENPELGHLQTRRTVLYENLKDLQFEYHQGKLSEQDYQSLKQGFLQDLAGVMDSIERLEPRRGKSERPSAKSSAALREQPRAERPAAVPQAIPCPSCQAPNPAGNRFCGRCGKPLAQSGD
jgi:hypothetical protein